MNPRKNRMPPTHHRLQESNGEFVVKVSPRVNPTILTQERIPKHCMFQPNLIAVTLQRRDTQPLLSSTQLSICTWDHGCPREPGPRSTEEARYGITAGTQGSGSKFCILRNYILVACPLSFLKCTPREERVLRIWGDLRRRRGARRLHFPSSLLTCLLLCSSPFDLDSIIQRDDSAGTQPGISCPASEQAIGLEAKQLGNGTFP